MVLDLKNKNGDICEGLRLTTLLLKNNRKNPSHSMASLANGRGPSQVAFSRDEYRLMRQYDQMIPNMHHDLCCLRVGFGCNRDEGVKNLGKDPSRQLCKKGFGKDRTCRLSV